MHRESCRHAPSVVVLDAAAGSLMGCAGHGAGRKGVSDHKRATESHAARYCSQRPCRPQTANRALPAMTVERSHWTAVASDYHALAAALRRLTTLRIARLSPSAKMLSTVVGAHMWGLTSAKGY